MIDISILRDDPERLKRALESRNNPMDFAGLLALDKKRRELLAELEALNKTKNDANEEISKILRQKGDAKAKIASMKITSQKIDEIKPKVGDIEHKFDEIMLLIPNIPSKDCPIGRDGASNKQIKEHKTSVKASQPPKNHVELAESLDIIDFKRGAKVSGASFVVYKGQGARLERALINFMLDVHTKDHGYTEVSPPFLVKRDCMVGTGQLPKFEEDMYRVHEPADLFLIPTAEVPITNLHRDEILSEEALPIRYAAYTPCFRLEAGTYGKDTKGLVRVHQFDKVELVKFCRPEDSYAEHEKLLANAERILQLLELPYRVMLLATGDMGFAAAKCYDLEVWAAGTGRWLETSSCSNFEDFQARRAGIKYKDQASGKTRYVHTLNSSGVALARTFIAIIENYQQPDGSVLIPSVLRPYMGGMTHIKK